MMTSLYWSVGAVDSIEWACVLCGHHIQNGWVRRATDLHQTLREARTSLCGNYLYDLKATAMGSWWLAASSRQRACSGLTSHAEFLWNIRSPRWLRPPQPRFGALWLLAFPQTKIFEREETQTIDEIRENTTGQLMAIGRTGWGPTLKGTEASLSCVQCFLCLVSSSANACFSWRAAGDLLDRPRTFVYRVCL